MGTIKVSGDLVNRERLSTSIDKGLYGALKNYQEETMIPMSKLMDEAIEDYLKKKGVSYTWLAPYRK